MPPTDRVVLLRQDGTKLEASVAEAEKLKLLGYREETPTESVQATTEASKEDYYTSTSQQAMAAGEGLLRGATLGGTDYLFGDEGTRERAARNAGIATAAELVGGIAPEFIPGLNAIAPSALVGKGAKAVAGTSKSLGATLTRGAIEGAAFGAAGAADHAYLAGDPVTSETVLHGIGWGTLFGVGISGAGAAIARRGASNLAKAAELEAGAAKLTGEANAVADIESSFARRGADIAAERSGLVERAAMERRGGPVFEAPKGAYEGAAGSAYRGFRDEAIAAADDIAKSTSTVDAIVSANAKKVASLGADNTISGKMAAEKFTELQKALSRVDDALNAGMADRSAISGRAVREAVEKYEERYAQLAEGAGASLGDSGATALKELAQLKVLQKELRRFPHSAEGFARMSAERAESLNASLASAKKLSRWPMISEALETSMGKMQESLGLQPRGLDGFMDTWKLARKSLASESKRVPSDLPIKKSELAAKQAKLAADRAEYAASVKPAAEKIAEAEPGWLRKAAGYAAGGAALKAGSALGHPIAALGAAHKVRKWITDFGMPKTPELIALRNASQARIRNAVGNYQTKYGNTVASYGPRSLATMLNGETDTSSKDPEVLAMNRIKEFAAASVHINNTMYRAVEPLMVEQPDVAKGMMDAGIASFNAMRSMLPADPGVVSGLKSIWKPSRLQAAVIDKQLSVFHDPIGAAEGMLSSGVYDPISVKAMQETAPGVYQYMREQMFNKIMEPGFLDGMTYKEQVALGAIFDIAIHSSMKPEYIAASQAMHMKHNQPEPLPSPAVPGSTNGGRPAESTPGATRAQVSEQR